MSEQPQDQQSQEAEFINSGDKIAERSGLKDQQGGSEEAPSAAGAEQDPGESLPEDPADDDKAEEKAKSKGKAAKKA